MSLVVWGMVVAGVVALVAGLVLARARFDAAHGWEKALVLGPVFEAAALAAFAAEHFFAARDLMGIVPRWLPGPLFWTYLVGAAWVAVAVSLVTWRNVEWSAAGTALLMLTFVATIHLPNLLAHLHERLFWTLVARESAFGGGAMVLAGSVWRSGKSAASSALMHTGRGVVAATMIFYAVEHFLFPRYAPGVPLGLLIPEWVPLPALLAYLVGIALLFGGVGLFLPRTVRMAAAVPGTVLALLAALFYVPIFMLERHTARALEGMNYIADTLLWAATVLLAGFGAEPPDADALR